jgi:hypothetical protein
MRIGGRGVDNPIAIAVAAKLFRMSAEQQIPGARGPLLPIDFLAGPEGVAVAKEHGELGLLQTFVPGEGNAVLIGGGQLRGAAAAREPNTTGISDLSVQLLASEQLTSGMRY